MGIDALKVGVEIDVAGGLPGIVVVGLPDTAVQESRERVKAALKNAGYAFPVRKIVINLTPADLRKEGPSFDLPISIGILAASEQVSAQLLGDHLFLGEVSLDKFTIASINFCNTDLYQGASVRSFPVAPLPGIDELQKNVPYSRRNSPIGTYQITDIHHPRLSIGSSVI